MQFEKATLAQHLLLYAITDRHWLRPGEQLTERVEQALRGGVTCVQLREKEMDETALQAEAHALKTLCHHYGVPLIINDNVRLARAVNADGVHVGQGDLRVQTASDVRACLGADKLLGVSAKTVAQAQQAQACGADYLGVGAVFPTGSKADATELPPGRLREICLTVDIPAVAIGGITPENVARLAGNGLAGIAVISAIFAAQDSEAAAKTLHQKAKEMLAR